jgi:biopolymer transport protein ExbB
MKLTSATGLIVGIVPVGYHWLNILVRRMVFRMENSAIEFMDILPGTINFSEDEE